MSDFPGGVELEPVISIGSGYGAAASVTSMMVSLAPASAAWPTANLGIFVPFALAAPYTVRSLYCTNGASVAGNIDLGIYSPHGTLIVSKGSTAQAGTDTLQILTVTETTLAAGRYYIALSCSSTSATFVRTAFGVVVQQLMGSVQAASQVPLAALPTFATPANSYVPHIGLASITTY